VAALAAAIVAGVLAGCADVPHSGPVKLGTSIGPQFGVTNESTHELTNETIHELPAGPLPDATPATLVAGFLHAMVDSEDGYGVARLFLAPGASWNSGQGITTYNPATMQLVRSGSRIVMRAQRVGEISARGSFTTAPAQITRRFGLVRSSGQWRIAHAPDGVLLSADDAQRTLQSADVYFLNDSENRLVPDPRLLPPQDPGLATTLIQDLVAGPSPSLAPAVHTAVPSGVSLIGNVPISTGGVAQIDFTNSNHQLSGAELRRLSAQVVWTLRQLASVTAVQLLVNGSPLSAPNVSSLQPIRAWPEFDPAAPPEAGGVLVVRDGQPGMLGARLPAQFVGSGLAAPARSADGTVLAGLRLSVRKVTLMIGRSTGRLVARAGAATMTAPAFDPAGDVFVARSGSAGEQIVEYPVHGSPVPVAAPGWLRAEPVQAIALAPDGSRLAAVVGPVGRAALMVGTISSLPAHPVIHDLHTVVPGGRNGQGVSWAAADELVCTVGQADGRRGVLEVSVDGYRVAELGEVGLVPYPDQIAAAPSRRILASSGEGIWSLSGGQWTRIATGSQPSYAG
jgi:hypothetical protein